MLAGLLPTAFHARRRSGLLLTSKVQGAARRDRRPTWTAGCSRAIDAAVPPRRPTSPRVFATGRLDHRQTAAAVRGGADIRARRDSILPSLLNPKRDLTVTDAASRRSATHHARRPRRPRRPAEADWPASFRQV
ncbi:hypothetical protein ACRAWD_27530 [Caulobacter segnis]